MNRSLLSIAASTALVLVSTSAAAHVRLVTPTPRHPTPNNEDDTIKTAPCGVEDDERTTDESRVTVYEPGETITVEFNETIDHPGFYRVSFDDDGQDAFDAPLSRSEVLPNPMLPVLLDDIDDHGPGGYSVMVTLPNMECENCTLQLIQVMSSGQSWAADDIYYTCADIALRSSGAGNGGSAGMGGVAGNATGGAGAGGTSGGGAGGTSGGGAGGNAGGMTGGDGGGSAAAGAGGLSGAGGANGGTSGTGNASAGGAASGGAGFGGTAAGSGSGASGGAGMAATSGAGGLNTSGSAGTSGTGSAATDAPGTEDPGCSCRTAASGGGARSLSLAAAALLLLGLRRARR